MAQLENINRKFIEYQSNNNITQNNLDLIVDSLNNLILESADKSFSKCTTSKFCAPNANPPSWFGKKCSKARKQFHTARFQYKLRKNLQNKENLKNASKHYKNTVKQFHRKHKTDAVKKLKNLKHSNPRKYWQILNGKKKSKVEAEADSLFNFFKDINNDDMNSTPESFTNSQPDTTSQQYSNEQINVPFSEEEIKKAINKLKNNKASGIDSILNEYLKALSHIISPLLVNLFNLIFDSGIFPETWTLGMINPIYKNKGDIQDPSNYRPITLLSCLGKVFTAVINTRIQNYVDEKQLLDNCQSGFRKHHSTTDNIFILHNLIELVCKGKNKLFCAFIDLKQAFDKVWRNGLWEKLASYDIKGKCLRIIKKIYENIKSCILVNGAKTNFFISNIGVGQGENLSPLLFNLFLNDLTDYFRTKQCQGITIGEHSLDENIFVYLKLFLLLYADDTIILADSAEKLQFALNIYASYCEDWRLLINYSKTKIIIFSKGKQTEYHFTLDSNTIEIVNEYKYLGVLFSKNNSFVTTKKHIAEQGSRAMYSLLRKARNMQLPIDLQIELFNKLVKPVLLYGCEVWGFGNIEIIERVQLKFLKYVLNLKKCTPNHIVYGEVGIYPLKIDIQTRIVSYWSKLLLPENLGTLATGIYLATKSHFGFSNINNKSRYFKWMYEIKSILNSTGFSGIWNSQDLINRKWFIKAINQKLRDSFLSEWYQKVDTDLNYRLFKHRFEFEQYLLMIPEQYRWYFISFRTRNHRLPVETGRWQNIELQERKCNLCSNAVGDEFHYMLMCDKLKEQRQNFLKACFYKRPNTLKYDSLMTSKNTKILTSVSKFIKTTYEICKQC